jgi:hypothetical protein
MTTLNQVIATTSSYLFSKASAIIHVLSGDLHCTTGHLELALSMLALILVSLYVLSGVLAMINAVLGKVVVEEAMCPPCARWTRSGAQSDQSVTVRSKISEESCSQHNGEMG